MQSRVLALDPSFRNTGWVFLHVGDELGVRILDAGVIRTEPSKNKKELKSVANHNATKLIARELWKLFTTIKPRYVLAESKAGSKSATAGELMAMAQAAVACTSEFVGYEVNLVTPHKVKKTLTGKTKASKEEIRDAVIAQYPDCVPIIGKIKPASKQEHAYDALAVFMAARGELDL